MKLKNGYFENVWQKEKQQREYEEDCREIQKAAAKAAAVEQVRIQSLQIKQSLREQEQERKKAVGERLEILSNGELQIMTENLAVEAIPRKVTNMHSPTLTVFKRVVDETEQIYKIECFVGEQRMEIFLEKNQAGNGAYFLRKFVSAGIRFMMPTAKGKYFASQLLGLLLSISEQEKLLPDMAGWMKKPDGSFTYVGEEELTWEKAKRLCR